MIKRTISIIAILAMILAFPAFSRATGGADTVTSATTVVTNTTVQTEARFSSFSADHPYTLEEMLTYAILDEYAAQRLYSSTVISHGSAEPFRRLLEEEISLINQLKQLLTDHRVVLPDPAAVGEQQTIASLREASRAGINAERISIEMYHAFLAKDNLPNDVRDVFQQILDASESHLDTLITKAGEEGWLQSTQYQGNRDDDFDYDDEGDDDNDDNDDNDDDDHEDDEDDD